MTTTCITLILIGLITSIHGLVEQKSIIRSINRERSAHKMDPIAYNYTLESQLKAIKPSDYFLNNSKITFNLTCGNYTLLRRRWIAFYNMTFDNNRYFIHDTTEESVLKIIKYRLGQRDCFNFNKCKEPYTRFVSCLKKCPIIPAPKRNAACNWAHEYYPKFLSKSLTSIACVLLDVQGPDVAEWLVNVQKKTFICYGNHKDPVSDFYSLN